MPHSKRNTSSAFFTSYERSLLRTSWGSQSTHLTRDSFLPFAACRLCLLPARDPVACSTNRSSGSSNSGSGSRPKTDIFCRECALSDLVAQTKEIKRLERGREDRAVEKDEEVRLARVEEERKELDRFERTAQGLEAKASLAGESRGKKRKVEEVEDERNQASFWVPGVDVKVGSAASFTAERPTKLRPICPASTPTSKHSYSLRTLIDVKFSTERESPNSTEDGGGKKGQHQHQHEPTRICPACTKALSNSSKAIVAKPCGHVVCGSCMDKFIRPADGGGAPDDHDGHDGHDNDARNATDTKRRQHRPTLCYVCETDVTEAKRKRKRKPGANKEDDRVRPGLVEINCEGTGFAGGGVNVASRDGVTFQC